MWGVTILICGLPLDLLNGHRLLQGLLLSRGLLQYNIPLRELCLPSVGCKGVTKQLHVWHKKYAMIYN